MRIARQTVLGSIAGLALMSVAGTAYADHGKVGLWSITITMGGDQPGMPDMSKLPPEVAARMKAAGVSMNGNTMTVQHCMTAQEVATDIPHMDPRNQKSCKLSHVQHSGHSMSADMTCTGAFTGTGHIQFTYDSSTHYSGEVAMTGLSQGHAMTHDQKFDGNWVSADCGRVDH